MNITEFLEARIAEDEAVAQAAIADDSGSDEGFSAKYEMMTKPPSGIGYAKGGFGVAAARMIATYAVPRRILAECAAKRAIIDLAKKAGEFEKWYDDYEWQGTVESSEPLTGDAILYALAAVYKDHPDYDPAWSPNAR